MKSIKQLTALLLSFGILSSTSVINTAFAVRINDVDAILEQSENEFQDWNIQTDNYELSELNVEDELPDYSLETEDEWDIDVAETGERTVNAGQEYDIPELLAAGDAMSGYCGNSLKWTLDGSELTISGTGDMWDYDDLWKYPSNNPSPWAGNKSITSIIINDGATSIGTNAFMYCNNVGYVTIPDSVKSIGNSAFSVFESLKNVYYGGNESEWKSIDIGSGNEYLRNSTIFYNTTTPIKSGTCGTNAAWDLDDYGTLTISGSGSVTDNPWSIYKKEITTVVIDGVTLPSGYFKECDNIEELRIESGSASWYYNSEFLNVKKLHIGKDGSIELSNMKMSLSSLREITVAGENTKYSSEDGVLFDKEKTTLYSFPKAKEITKYLVPDTVNTIYDSAFYECKSLTSIEISESVNVIEEYAFYGCTSLNEIELPDHYVSISTNAFINTAYYNDTENWQDNILYVGKFLVYTKSSELSGDIKIKDGTKYIVDGSFVNRSGLTGITVPNSVETIGGKAFSGCDNLASILLPDSITSIGANAFTGTAYYNDESNWENGLLYIGTNLIASKIDEFPSYCIIKDGTRCIANAALQNDSIPDEDTIVSFPDSVKYIDYYAFRSKTSLYIECYKNSAAETYAKENSINYYYFGEPDIIRGRYKSEIDWTLDANTGLLTISGRSEISEGTARWPRSKIKDIVIEEGITGLDQTELFASAWDKSHFETITLPKSVEYIDFSSIGYACGAVVYAPKDSYAARFAISSGMQYAEPGGTPVGKCGDNLTWTFENGTLTIDGTGDMWDFDYFTSYVGSNSPWNTLPLEKIRINEGVTSVGDFFLGYIYNSNISEVSLPDSLESIGRRAFFSCFDDHIILPPNIKEIKPLAFGFSYQNYDENSEWYFRNCLLGVDEDVIGEEYTIKSGTTCIANAVLSSSNLTKISLEGDNPDFTVEDGVLFNKDKTILVCYPPGKEGDTYTVPDSVERIGNYAFYKCEQLKQIILPDGLKEIGDSAFSDCGIEKIDLPDGLERIGQFAFSDSDLIEVVIPNSVTIFEPSVFQNCQKLVSAKLCDNMKTIPAYTFNDCKSLTDIDLPPLIDSIGDSAFRFCSGLKEIVIPPEVVNIGPSAFAYCSNLNTVTMDKNVKYIDSYCFAGCISMTKVKLSTNIKGIRSFAFNGCAALETLFIGKNVDTICEGALYCGGDVIIAKADAVISENAFYQDSHSKEKDPNLTIYSYRGSSAENAAKNCNVNFVEIECGEYGDAVIERLSMEYSENGFIDTSFTISSNKAGVIEDIYIGAYDINGRLLGVDMITVLPDTGQNNYSVSLNVEGIPAYVKTFVFDCKNKLMPLCESKKVSVQ